MARASRRRTEPASPLMSADDLRAQLTAPDLRVLDASWHMPATGRDARAEYRAAHVPGALFFDLEDLSDERSALPHMAPSPEKFASRMRALGVGDGCRVVVYDTVGFFSAPRAWWMFRYFGVEDAFVLDGGLPAWTAAGGDLEDLEPPKRRRHLTPSRRAMLMRDVTDVAAAVKLGSAEIIDARAPERFRGEVDEPRAGLRAGRIPGSKNVPFTALVAEDGRMRDPDALRAVFDAAGVDLSQPIMTSCGSGVTAAVVNLALDRIGVRDHAVYDGSWTEWGASEMLPIERG